MKHSVKTYRYIVQGRVQGVAFRYYTLHAAREHRIRGTVKNLYNGDVEVHAQGEPEDLQSFEDFLHTGPPAARVLKVIKNVTAPASPYHGFDVIY